MNEIISLEQWDASLNSHLKLESMSTKKDSLFCRIIENNDWFKAVNVIDLIHDPTVFIIAEGKIKKIIAYPSEKTGEAIGNAIGSIYQWLATNQDSTIYNLIQNDQFVYSKEAANQWIELFNKIDTLKEEELSILILSCFYLLNLNDLII